MFTTPDLLIVLQAKLPFYLFIHFKNAWSRNESQQPFLRAAFTVMHRGKWSLTANAWKERKKKKKLEVLLLLKKRSCMSDFQVKIVQY